MVLSKGGANRKAQKAKPLSGDSGAVVSEPFKHKRLKHPSHFSKKLALSILLLAFLISLGVFFWQFRDNKSSTPQVTLKSGQSVTGQVDLLDDGEVAALAATRVDPNKDMGPAHAKALALARQENFDAALSEYEKIDKTGKAPYYIYVDYALTAARSGNVVLAVEKMEVAIQKLTADSSVDADTKTAELRILNSKLAGFKESVGGTNE